MQMMMQLSVGERRIYNLQRVNYMLQLKKADLLQTKLKLNICFYQEIQKDGGINKV